MRFVAVLACICLAILALPSRVLATDSSLAWVAGFSSPTGEQPQAFTVDAAGNAYAVSIQFFNALGYCWFIRKIDPFGHLLWSQTYAASYIPYDIAADANGNVFITGVGSDSAGHNLLVLAKYDTFGQLAWLTSVTSAEGECLHVDSSGNIYVGGSDDSTRPPQTLLIEYNTDGQVIATTSLPGITPLGTFFLANGSLLSSGSGSSGPAYEVYSPTGSPLFGGSASDSSFFTVFFHFASDSSSDLYVATESADTLTFTSSYVLSAFTSTGSTIWTTQTQNARPYLLTASDSNHVYVGSQANGTDSFVGFGNGGNQFTSIPGGTINLIAADGSTGIVAASNSSTTFTISEITPSQQTLWNQTGTDPSGQSASVKIFNGAAYVMFSDMVQGTEGTIIAKVTQGVGLSSIKTNTSSVQGGNKLQVTLELNDLAPSGGFPVALSGSAAFIGLPSQVVLSAGKNSTTFDVKTLPVDAPVAVEISAEASGVTRHTSLVVSPATLTGLSFPGGSSATVTGGQTITGTVHLSGVTGLAGRAVALSSSNSKATVPAQIVVPAGDSTVTFTVQTSAVAASTPVSITAKVSGGSSTSASFTITP